ncbi:unnamed protein product [Ilex paraguariensis]|uniref:Uncharacterized protein n=1 Tax=Ilex paraguariensis TaxID=185542 RepID=A0ABC8TA45_9AQUA
MTSSSTVTSNEGLRYRNMHCPICSKRAIIIVSESEQNPGKLYCKYPKDPMWMAPITLPSSEITNERMDVRRIEDNVQRIEDNVRQIEDNVRRIEELCTVVQRVEAKEGSMKSNMFVITLVVVMLIFVILVKWSYKSNGVVMKLVL